MNLLDFNREYVSFTTNFFTISVGNYDVLDKMQLKKQSSSPAFNANFDSEKMIYFFLRKVKISKNVFLPWTLF